MPTQDRVSLLVRKGVSFLYVDLPTWQELQAGRHEGRQFSIVFSYETARSARPSSLAIVSTDDLPGLFVALVRTIQKVSTLDSRVTFDFVRSVSPYTLEDLLGDDGTPLHHAVTRVALEGGHAFTPIPAQLARTLTERLVNEPGNAGALQPIIDYIGRPQRYTDARALQQDALELALKAFGASPEATTLSLTGRETALDRLAIQEDVVIEHDARWIPGWRLTQSDLTGRAVFRNKSDELQVFTANRQALEELFGVDLIYLNERRGSLVMVQYKMMEPTPPRRYPARPGRRREREWTVAIDDHFLDQVDRMSLFDCDLEPDGPYRLNCGAFYFKLVKRNAGTTTAGVMLSLEHLRQMLERGGVHGPRGGLRISYGELDGHYLRGEAWIELVRSGYVGSRGATTTHMEMLMEEAITGGRAAVAAIHRRLRA